MKEFSLMPFWFWNDDMDNNEIIRQIQLMKEQGVEAFYICARQGLNVPYLSNEWFNKVSVAVEAAKKNEMDVWFYDEFPYPSGISGGEVVNGHSEYEATILKQIVMEVKSNQTIDQCFDWGEVLSAVAYPLNNGQPDWKSGRDIKDYIGNSQIEKTFKKNNLVRYNSKRFFTEGLTNRLYFKADNEDYLIHIFVSKKLTNFKYFGSFVDPLMPGAVDRFIATTHEKYKKHFESEFGKTIKGFFTDEISPYSEQSHQLVWSKALPELFRQRNGYDIKDHLIHIVEYVDDTTPKIRYDYYNTITEAFIDAYDKKIKKWCNDNNLLYVGEKPILRSEQLQYFDIPGIDAGHQKVGDLPDLVNSCYRHSPKILSSAAHFYNKEYCLCECFHSIGWSLSMQDMKWMFDWLSIMGVNIFVLHAFYYSSDSLLKHDAPPSSFFQMPAWKHTHIISNYVKNMHTFLKEATRKVDVLLVDPITSVWTDMPNSKEHFKNFKMIQDQLIKHGIDYYIIDQRLLENATINGATISINGESFKYLILPFMRNIEKQAAHIVGQFVNTLFLDKVPFEKIQDIDPKDFLSNVGSDNIFESIDSLAEFLQSRLFNEVEIVKNENVIFATYRKDNKDVLIIMNTEGKSNSVTIKSNFNQEFCMVDLEGEDITVNSINSYIENNIRYTQLHFCEFQTMILISSDIELNNDIECVSKETSTKKITFKTKEKWEFKACNLNALRLYKWQLSVNESTPKLVEAMPIINQIDAGEYSIPAKANLSFGCSKQLLYKGVNAKYELSFEIKDMPNSPLYLVMEPNSICGDWVGYINNNKISINDFKTKEIYMPTNLCCDISDKVNIGSNSIKIVMHTNETYDGVINPIYIFGQFSVSKSHESTNGYCIAEINKNGIFCDYEDCGLIFYAGDIDFTKTINLKETENITVALDENILYPVEMFLDDKSMGVRCWAPYEWHIDNIQNLQSKITFKVTNDLLGLFEGERIEKGANLRISY